MGRGWLAKDKLAHFPMIHSLLFQQIKLFFILLTSLNVPFLTPGTLCLQKKPIHNLFFTLLVLLPYFVKGMKFS